MILNYCSIRPSLSIQKRNQKSFWGLWAPLFLSFYWEEVVGTLRRGFILAHYDIVITFCYLITIPKHINDMEDLLSHPIWCLSLVAFASISLLFCFYFSFHFFPDSTNATYEKKDENKNQHKSVSWQPMVTCKHNMAHCSLAYVKRWVGSRRYS